MELKIYNGTPHAINVVKKDSCTFNAAIRKWVATDPETVAQIASDGVLSARIETVESGAFGNVPVFSKKIVGIDPLPEGYDIYVVSALYVSAARQMGYDTSKLYTVADPVYSEDGRTILGSKGICPAF